MHHGCLRFLPRRRRGRFLMRQMLLYGPLSARAFAQRCIPGLKPCVRGYKMPKVRYRSPGVHRLFHVVYVTDNFTRFILLSISNTIPLPVTSRSLAPPDVPRFEGPRALLRLSLPCQSHHPPLPTILSLFCQSPLSLARLDRRPSLSKLPFHDVYIVEIGSSEADDRISHWLKSLESAITKARKEVGRGDLSLLGKWGI